jgi:hypothetical protein
LAAELKAKAEEDRVVRRARAVLGQLPNTKAFRKVSLDDAIVAVHCVDHAARCIEARDPGCMARVDDILGSFVKSVARAHVAEKMICVQGLNLKTGVVHGSQEALRENIEKQLELERLAKLERQRNYAKCVVCKVQNAFLNSRQPRGPWDVTHCVKCADPEVHVHHWVYTEGKGRRVRLENVKPHRYACAALV